MEEEIKWSESLHVGAELHRPDLGISLMRRGCVVRQLAKPLVLQTLLPNCQLQIHDVHRIQPPQVPPWEGARDSLVALVTPSVLLQHVSVHEDEGPFFIAEPHMIVLVSASPIGCHRTGMDK